MTGILPSSPASPPGPTRWRAFLLPNSPRHLGLAGLGRQPFTVAAHWDPSLARAVDDPPRFLVASQLKAAAYKVVDLTTASPPTTAKPEG